MKRLPAKRYITRFDYSNARGFRTLVVYRVKGVRFEKFFSVSKYVSWAKARLAATRYRNGLIRRNGLPTNARYRRTYAANTSGCIGVSMRRRRYMVKGHGGKVHVQVRKEWTAQYQFERRRTVRKSFSVSRWGARRAYKKAVAQRRAWVAGLSV